MTRNALAQTVLFVFVGLPLLFFFQNCGGYTGSRATFVPSSLGLSSGFKPVKLSGTLVSGGDVDVVNYEFTGDSAKVVFMADKDTDDLVELYAVNRDGSDPVKLSQGGQVESFRLAGLQVIYLSENASGHSELFVVNLDGSGRTSLSGTPADGGRVRGFDVTPDQQKVVFLADKDVAGVPELFSVPVGGGSPVKLHPDLSAGQQVSAFKALNGAVLFIAKTGSLAQGQLYSTPHDGSGFIALSAPGPKSSAGVTRFESDLTGSRIAYLADIEVPGKKELYLTNADGSQQGKISPAGIAGSIQEFQLTPDGSHAVFLGDLEGAGHQELYQRDLSLMSAVTKINPALTAGGNVTRFVLFQSLSLVNNAPILTPGVAFLADAVTNDKFELYLTKDIAAMATRMNGDLNPAGDVFDFTLSGDGRQLAYVADQEVDGRYELFVKPPDSTPAVRAASGRKDQDIVPPLAFASDDQRVLFVGDLEIQGRRELYVTREGGDSQRLSFAWAGEADVFSFKLSPDGKWILFAGDQQTNGVDELFVAPMPLP